MRWFNYFRCLCLSVHYCWPFTVENFFIGLPQLSLNVIYMLNKFQCISEKRFLYGFCLNSNKTLWVNWVFMVWIVPLCIFSWCVAEVVTLTHVAPNYVPASQPATAAPASHLHLIILTTCHHSRHHAFKTNLDARSSAKQLSLDKCTTK